MSLSARGCLRWGPLSATDTPNASVLPGGQHYFGAPGSATGSLLAYEEKVLPLVLVLYALIAFAR